MSKLKTNIICLLLSILYMLFMFALIVLPELFYEPANYNVVNVFLAIHPFIIFLILTIYSILSKKRQWDIIYKQRDTIINYVFLGIALGLMPMDLVISITGMIFAQKAINSLLYFLIAFISLEIFIIALLSIILVSKSNQNSVITNSNKEKIGTKSIGFCLNLSFIYMFSFFIINKGIEDSHSFKISHTIFLVFIYINLFVLYLIWFIYFLCMERKNMDLIYKKENKITNIVFTALLGVLFLVNMVILIICYMNWKVSFYSIMDFTLIILLVIMMILSILNTVKISKKLK